MCYCLLWRCQFTVIKSYHESVDCWKKDLTPRISKDSSDSVTNLFFDCFGQLHFLLCHLSYFDSRWDLLLLHSRQVPVMFGSLITSAETNNNAPPTLFSNEITMVSSSRQGHLCVLDSSCLGTVLQNTISRIQESEPWKFCVATPSR